MTWTPDPQLDLHIQRLITRAFEDALDHESAERQRMRNDLSARGLLRSGAELTGSEKLAAQTLDQFAARAIREVLDAIRDVLGDVPASAIEWVRQTLAARIDGFANGRATSLMEQRISMNVPTAGAREAVDRAAFRAKRDLEIAIQPIELRARLGTIARGELPGTAPGPRDIDAFISHAGEDKTEVARPITDGLRRRGFGVWLDEYELVVGRSVYAAIDDGLRRARFGVVILSPSFFAKQWPQNELHALAALSAAEGVNKILPVWHKVGHQDVARFSPLLADVFAAKMIDGLVSVVEQIAAALGAGSSAKS